MNRNAIGKMREAARRTHTRGIAVVLCALVSGCGSQDSQSDASPTAGLESVSQSTWPDLLGKPVNPFRGEGSKAVVFIFIANDCPISNRYAPEIRRLYESFHAKGVSFWLVHPNAEESNDAITRHAQEYRCPMGILRDPGHTLVQRAEVRVTPEAAVFLPDARLAYHGRIDDRYVDFGKHRPEPTSQDLRQALEEILAGQSVSKAVTRAIGCAISGTP